MIKERNFQIMEHGLTIEEFEALGSGPTPAVCAFLHEIYGEAFVGLVVAAAVVALLSAALFLFTRPRKLRRLSMPQRGIIAVSAFLVLFSAAFGLSLEAYRWYEVWPIWPVAVIIAGFIEYRLFAPAALKPNEP